MPRMHSQFIFFGKRNDEEVITCQECTVNELFFAKRNDGEVITCQEAQPIHPFCET